MRPSSPPHPLLFAVLFGALALTFPYVAGPIHLNLNAWLPGGVVSWSTVSLVDPIEDYLWYGECLAVGAVAATVVILAYQRIGRLRPHVDGRSPAIVLSGIGSLTRGAIVLAAVLWMVHATAFNPSTVISNQADLQPINPAGMRFDTFHDGERLGFRPTITTSANALSDTYFIHGFGMDAGPAELASVLLPTVDPIVGMRIFLLCQLALTCVAALWAAREAVLAGGSIGAQATARSLAFLLFLLVSRTVYPHLLLATVDLALVLWIVRSDAASRTRMFAISALAGAMVPLGTMYSYTGVVISIVVLGVGFLFGATRVGKWSWAGLLAGLSTTTLAIMFMVGGRQMEAVLGQIAYWIRWGATIWDLPPLVLSGPRDVIFPALLCALVIQLTLVVWLIWKAAVRPSWSLWLDQTRPAWILLAFAAIGTRDALDRGGFDYGERALAASAFGLIFLVSRSIGSLRLSFSERGLRLASVAAIVLIMGSIAMTGSLSQTAAATLLPPDFAQAARVVGPTLPPGGCVYTLTSEGLWYAVLERPSCSRFHQVTYARTTDAQDEVIASLSAKRPPVVIFSNSTSYNTFDGFSVASTSSRVTRWVIRHYLPAELVGSAWFWVPGSPPELRSVGSRPLIPARLDNVQRGSEITLTGSLDWPGASPGDAVYATFDDEHDAVSAGPVIGIGGLMRWTVPIPTVDRDVGPHTLRLWVAPSGNSFAQPASLFTLTITPRLSRLGTNVNPIDIGQLTGP
jgi:hypothetical protein